MPTKYLKHKALFPPQIKTIPTPDLDIIVVIPCFDEPDAIKSLHSLLACTLPQSAVEVILVINHSRNASEGVKQANQKTYKDAIEFARKESSSRLQFFVLFHSELPPKHAGVGLARKIGMDEAAYRLEYVEHPNGIIVCYDADSNCDPNYFIEIERHFNSHQKSTACSIYFEHPTDGNKFSSEVYRHIIDYELHLRYYVNALRWAGFPHAYQTIGSSMAVRAIAYQQQGGMNRRKAGEDFYFLQKFIPLGSFTELNTTRVIPSPRPSHRVPFGTGKAIQDQLARTNAINRVSTTHNILPVTTQTYSPKSFEDLSIFIKNTPQLTTLTGSSSFLKELPPSISNYLNSTSFEEKLVEIKHHTSSPTSFLHRFFLWFNAFQVLKFVHYARDHYYPNIEVGHAASILYDHNHSSNLELLQYYRNKDRKNSPDNMPEIN